MALVYLPRYKVENYSDHCSVMDGKCARTFDHMGRNYVVTESTVTNGYKTLTAYEVLCQTSFKRRRFFKPGKLTGQSVHVFGSRRMLGNPLTVKTDHSQVEMLF